MSLVIPVDLPDLRPAPRPRAASTSLARPGAALQGQRTVAPGDRERFRRSLHGVRSYKAARLSLVRVGPPQPSLADLADEDLGGLGRFRGFRGIRRIAKAITQPKNLLKVAAVAPMALAPAAILSKGLRQNVSRFVTSTAGKVAGAALLPMAAPLLLAKPAMRLFAGGGGGSEEEAAPTEVGPAAVPGGTAPMTMDAAGGFLPQDMPPSTGPSYVAQETEEGDAVPDAGDESEASQAPVDAEEDAGPAAMEWSAMPGGEDAATDDAAADAVGPLVLDATAGDYAPEVMPDAVDAG